jgi:hypothetical protein
MSRIPADNRSPISVFRRAVTIAEFGLVAGALFWIAWLAVTRWDGQPDKERPVAAGFLPVGPPIKAEMDRTADLVAAFSSFPPAPVVNLPPPPDGMRWTATSGRPVSFLSVLSGSWTRESRPNLEAVVGYILSPGVETSLQKLAKIPPGGWRLGGGTFGMSTVRRTAKILVARARYHHAERGDVKSAVAELASVYRLSEIVYESGTLIGVMVAMACDAIADSELIRLSQERRLDRREAALATVAVRESMFEFRDLWRTTIDARVGELVWMLDTSYTNDGDGNGWLALSYLRTTMSPVWAANRRCGAWNVLSPVFNGRRTIEGKIASLRRGYERALSLPYEQARELLVTCEARTIFGIADGPLALESNSSLLGRMFDNAARHVARRRATVTSVALSVYRTETGRYPDSLDELVPGHLDEVPLDPVDDRPLRYVRKSDEEYLLYSVGSNLLDDGGVPPTIDESKRMLKDGDWILTRPRSEHLFEPVLERIEP